MRHWLTLTALLGHLRALLLRESHGRVQVLPAPHAAGWLRARQPTRCLPSGLGALRAPERLPARAASRVPHARAAIQRCARQEVARLMECDTAHARAVPCASASGGVPRVAIKP